MIITGMLPHLVAEENIHFSAHGTILILPRCIDDLQASNPLYSSICGLFLVYTSVRDQYYSQSKQKRARRACPQGHNAESSRVCTLCEFPVHLHQLRHYLAFGHIRFEAVALHYCLVVGFVGFSQFGGHGQFVVEVGEG